MDAGYPPNLINIPRRFTALCALTAIEAAFRAIRLDSPEPFAALGIQFDERVVAAHLKRHFGLEIDLAGWFAWLRELAEQTYENKAQAFGFVIVSENKTADLEVAFPGAFLNKKKYRVLCDGYRTAYWVSGAGAILGFGRLGPTKQHRRGYFPEWCTDLAEDCHGRNLGVCLTRQGDILVLDGGQLRFSYRFGRWCYWNHTHIVDLIQNAARVQHVRPTVVADVVRTLYRGALDISFRRSGGLFVILRRRDNVRSILRRGDAIGDYERDYVDWRFDLAIKSKLITRVARPVLAALAALDGAVVISNGGAVLAYGAVLEPKRRLGIVREEGSRTKAAIGASHYGLAIKISSDGNITVFGGGKAMLEI